MKKPLAGLIIVAVGAGFVITTLVANLYRAGPAFERMTTNFRPHMTQTAIARYRSDLTGLGAVNAEFTTKVAPALSRALGMTQAQFNAYVARQFPAVSTGLRAMPAVGTSFNTVLTTLNNERARFASADAIPTSSLPATALPWALLGVGLIAIAVGGWLMAGSRAAAIIAVGLAAALIVVPLALSLPAKASNADTMNGHLKPVYTAQLVTGAEQSLQTLQAMGSEMRLKMIPALAQALNLTPAQTQAYFASNFPTVWQGLQTLPAALTRFSALARAFGRSLADYGTLKQVSLLPVVWLIIGGGIVTLLAALGSTVRRRAEVATIWRVPAKAA